MMTTTKMTTKMTEPTLSPDEKQYMEQKVEQMKAKHGAQRVNDAYATLQAMFGGTDRRAGGAADAG